eukprot:PhM_4_TR16142/c0_g1_i9/m.31827
MVAGHFPEKRPPFLRDLHTPALCKLPAQPPSAQNKDKEKVKLNDEDEAKNDCGKLYEKVTLLALACRIATSPDALVPLSKLVGKYSCSERSEGEENFFDTLVDCEATPQPTKFKEETFVFPRAAFKDPTTGKWDNTDCSKMPPLAAAPWFSDSSHVHKYNVVIDGLLVLKTADGTTGVALGLQNKEVARPADVLTKFREHRVTHLEWRGKSRDRISNFLGHHTFVHVLVTPNEPEGFTPGTFEVFKGTKGETTCYEALITHEDIRRWSPMVAYSGCDARVLQIKNSNSDQEQRTTITKKNNNKKKE